MSNEEKDLGELLRQQRAMKGLTIGQLSEMSGVSPSYLGRIERGERSPSAGVLRRLAQPLGFEQVELLTFAGYLSPEPSSEAGGGHHGLLDPYVAKVLSEECVEVQRAVVGILSILKSIGKGIAKGSGCDIGFVEYAHRKYPELDEDLITMIEDLIIERQTGGLQINKAL